MERLEALLEWGGVKKDVVCLVLGGISLLVSIFELAPGLPFDAAWVAIILCGAPIVLEAVVGLVTAFDIKADVLVSMALIASVIIGEDFAAGEVAFIMQLGALLEDLTVAKARAGIEKLVQLTPQTARRISASGEETVPAECVQVGDLLRVLPGETIPVDGVIVSGVTSVNQAVMTGESLPVDKAPGDEVSSGTVNQFGSFDMRASKVGEDSSIQRMIRLVEDILRLSQLDEGGSSLQTEEVDLYHLAQEVAGRLTPAAVKGQVTLEVTGGPVRISGVRQLLDEMISNLCDNAIKYNRPGGRVTISVSRSDRGAELSVSDTGIGIPPEDQSRVFERFYRVDKSHSKAIGGTGLGLSIVKHGAAFHGADLSLESQPDRGTTIRLTFPGQNVK